MKVKEQETKKMIVVVPAAVVVVLFSVRKIMSDRNLCFANSLCLLCVCFFAVALLYPQTNNSSHLSFDRYVEQQQQVKLSY